MARSIDSIVQRQIQLTHVREDGPLTQPRSYGVYQLPASAKGTRRFRFGNHLVRMRELQREFGRCERKHLFLSRADALEVARWLSANEA